MILKLLTCLALVSLAASKSLIENERYMIVLHDNTALYEVYKVMEAIELHEERGREEMEMKFINNLLPIVIANISKDTANKVQSLKEVNYIEADQLMYMNPILSPVQLNFSKWLDNPIDDLGASTDHYNLDIMNKPVRVCRNNEYIPPNDGTGADLYILDTGINFNHNDFKGTDGLTRAKYSGIDVIKPSTGGKDCHGHGSHCAGIAGGLQSGVAKNVNLYSVRVLGCTGSGSTSGIVTALDQVSVKHDINKGKPYFVGSIVSMSLGGGISTALNNEVNKLVSNGLVVVTASGNDGADACLSSPGSAGDNINVGAHKAPVETNSECLNPIESFSNWGTCVDVIAPGKNILSVDYSNNVDYTTMSGTSMACPHVSGTAALMMKHDKRITPAKLKAKIVALAADDIDRSKQSSSVRDVSHSERLYVPTSF